MAGHILRITDNQLTEKTLNFIKPKGMKLKWFPQCEKDLRQIGITEYRIKNGFKRYWQNVKARR